jgi:hypothetical protein
VSGKLSGSPALPNRPNYWPRFPVIPALIIDPERLQQVVINIIANVVKFSAVDGAVDVELRRNDQFAEIVVVITASASSANSCGVCSIDSGRRAQRRTEVKTQSWRLRTRRSACDTMNRSAGR